MEPDPGLFVFDLPVWAIAVAKSGETPVNVPVRDPAIGFVTAATERGLALALFTDEDLAVTFAQRSTIADPVALALVSAADLLSFLEVMAERGFGHVCFDPGPPSRRTLVKTIAEVADVARRRIG
jgi:hypothetical protein